MPPSKLEKSSRADKITVFDCALDVYSISYRPQVDLQERLGPFFSNLLVGIQQISNAFAIDSDTRVSASPVLTSP